MENVRRSAGYAESQIRSLLNDLNNTSHTLRLKAIKHFQQYIETYTPGDTKMIVLLLNNSQISLNYRDLRR